MFHQFGLLGLMAAATLVAGPSFAFATDRYWSANSGDWSTDSNWGGSEPTINRDCILDRRS